ncbi:hypothetical protein [Microcoleus sp. Pol12B4]|uniref:hypothetical protein n=1 Tax=Microcoleus sp. Pol12B4 TaxID=3055395 RepID=UPI002FD32ED7
MLDKQFGCEIASAVRILKVAREAWERELRGENGVFLVLGVSGGLAGDFIGVGWVGRLNVSLQFVAFQK